MVIARSDRERIPDFICLTIIGKLHLTIQVSTALTLRYTPTPRTRSQFDTYRFQLSDPADQPVQEKAAGDPERLVGIARRVAFSFGITIFYQQVFR